jgi:hypothetical protein
MIGAADFWTARARPNRMPGERLADVERGLVDSRTRRQASIV